MSTMDYMLDDPRDCELGSIDLETKYVLELEHRLQQMEARIAQLEEENEIDELTGVKNKKGMLSALKGYVESSRRTLVPLTVIMFDLDHFKWVNDSYGHEAGDTLLRKVGEIMLDNHRANDYVARYGGEEFVVLTQNGIEGGLKLAERLRSEIEAALVTLNENETLSVTASFGVTQYRPGLEDTLIERADKAMYESKRSGRNMVTTLDDKGTW